MKLSKSRLRKIIQEEVRIFSEGLGFSKLSPWGSKKTISKRAQLNRHGKEDEYELRYYIVITEPDGDRHRHAYSAHTDDQAWEEAARLKRDGDFDAGSEFDIYEDTVKGDRYIGAIAGYGMDDDELFTENLDLVDPEDPQEAYDGEDPIGLWHELGDLLTDADLSLYEMLGSEKYESIVPIAREYAMMKLREAYGRYFKLVARSPEKGVERDSETGEMKIQYSWENEYNLLPGTARDLFDQKTGNLTRDQAEKMIARKNELQPLFKRADASDASDSMYGRRRHAIIHIESGKQVDGGVNKQGSLGT